MRGSDSRRLLNPQMTQIFSGSQGRKKITASLAIALVSVFGLIALGQSSARAADSPPPLPSPLKGEGAMQSRTVATQQLGIYPPLGAKAGKHGKVSWDKESSEYVFRGTGVEYRLSVTEEAVQRGLLRVKAKVGDSAFFYPVTEAGTRYRDGEGKLLEPAEFAAAASVKLLSHRLLRDEVILEYEEAYEQVVRRKTFSLRQMGGALAIEARAEGTDYRNNYAGFAFGAGEDTPGARIVDIPYAVVPIVSLEGGRFYSAYLDWSESSSLLLQPQAWYRSSSSVVASVASENASDTAGKVAPLHELAYITVSDNPLDCLPQILNPPSPYRHLLNDKVVVDWWGLEWPFSRWGKIPRLQASRTLLDSYHSAGMTSLAVIYHDWQYYGYDAGLPAHYPVNPAFGTDEELRDLVQAAISAGGLFALHENFRDMYPNNPGFLSPYFDAEALAYDSAGKPLPGWYNPTTKQQASALSLEAAPKFAAKQGRLISRGYGPNAAFLDISPAWSPAGALDLRVSNPTPKTLAEAMRQTRQLFLQQHSIYQGPLFGEGGEGPYRFDTLFAGSVDGVERQIEGRSLAYIAPDYELRVVKPLMANHGMGYYTRYFARQGNVPGFSANEDGWDLYRASEIAFNHAGFISDNAPSGQPFMEYHLLQQLQSLYLAGRAISITYQDGEESLSLGQAMARDYDFLNSRVSVSYDNGLRLYVNHASGARDSEKDFAGKQGRFGWRYEEWEGDEVREMTFDWKNSLWKGSAPGCVIMPHGANPSGAVPVRTWTAPYAGKVRLRGEFADLDGRGGDGVEIRVLKGNELLWSKVIENGDSRGGEFALRVEVQKGDSLHFLVDPRSEPSYDTTRFIITLSYVGDSAPVWKVAGPEGEDFSLPANGWLAWRKDGKFLEYSALVNGKRAEYVRSPAYTFANARGAGWRKIADISTDGLAVLRPGREGRDVHLVQATGIAQEKDTIRLSAKADVDLLYQEGARAIVQARNLSVGKEVEITYHDLPRAWTDKQGRPKPSLVIRRLEADGKPGEAVEWNSPGGKEVRFVAEANTRYLIAVEER